MINDDIEESNCRDVVDKQQQSYDNDNNDNNLIRTFLDQLALSSL